MSLNVSHCLRECLLMADGVWLCCLTSAFNNLMPHFNYILTHKFFWGSKFVTDNKLCGLFIGVIMKFIATGSKHEFKRVKLIILTVN